MVKDPATGGSFQQRYWNEHTQHEIRKKLEFGYFQPAKDKSRAEYATRMFTHISELTPVLEQKEVIRRLARHYGDEIKYIIVERRIHRCEQLIVLLEKFDKIGSTNNGYLKNKEWRNKNNFSRDNNTHNFGT